MTCSGFPANSPLESQLRLFKKRVTLAHPPSYLPPFSVSSSSSSSHLSVSETKAPPHLLPFFPVLSLTAAVKQTLAEREERRVSGRSFSPALLICHTPFVVYRLFPARRPKPGSIFSFLFIYLFFSVMATDADPRKCESCRFLPAVNL